MEGTSLPIYHSSSIRAPNAIPMLNGMTRTSNEMARPSTILFTTFMGIMIERLMTKLEMLQS